MDSFINFSYQRHVPLMRAVDASFSTVSAEFKKLKTAHERVDFSYDYMKSKLSFAPEIFFEERRVKSDDLSLKYRQKGNELFRANKCQEALVQYVKSIAFAKNGSSLLGLAYANRSAVLFQKEFYKECLEDIERALQSNYPDHLKEKLIDRQTRANTLKELNQRHLCYHQPTPNLIKKNARIPAAADCVEMKNTESYGIHVVTTRDVKPGEVISVEKPFVQWFESMTGDEFLHCNECLELCFNMVPCKNCPDALYCSNTCKDVSVCKHMCNVSSFYLEKLPGVKVTLFGAKYINKGSDNDSEERNISDQYKEILALETNERLRDAIVLFKIALVAGTIFHVLKRNANFMGQIAVNKTILKAMLYRNLLVQFCSSIAISKIGLLNHGMETSLVARGMYPFSSHYSHSCAPNCLGHFYGSTMVVRATKPIKKGEQCTIIYGWNYINDDYEKRQAMLWSLYCFKCECVACHHKWPTYPGMNVKYLKDERDLLEPLDKISKCCSKPTREVDIEPLLSKCFELQSKVKEPSEPMTSIIVCIELLMAYSGNRNIQF